MTELGSGEVESRVYLTVENDPAADPRSESDHDGKFGALCGSGYSLGFCLSLIHIFSLAKEIVSLHKGTISASNDGGAVFEIGLPLR